MKRLLCPLVVVPLLLIGCTEDRAEPDVTGLRAELEAPARAFTPDGSQLVVAIKGGPEPVSTPYTLRIAGILYGLDTAGGHATLVDQSDPSRRFHYRFSEGEARCEGGIPVARFSGKGFATGERGTPAAFVHQFNFGLSGPPPPSDDRGETTSSIIVAALIEGAPAELVGETFRIEAERAYFSPDICDTR